MLSALLPRNNLKLVVTGHRPKDLGGYSQLVADRVYATAHDQLLKISPSIVGTGMAIGWDQAVAQACVDLRIPFIAFVPFRGQEKTWPRTSQLRYHQLLEQAKEIRISSPGGFSPVAMSVRNSVMVQWGDALLALYNGKQDGGTWHAIKLAKMLKKPITNCWTNFNVVPPQKELPLS